MVHTQEGASGRFLLPRPTHHRLQFRHSPQVLQHQQARCSRLPPSCRRTPEAPFPQDAWHPAHGPLDDVSSPCKHGQACWQPEERGLGQQG